MWTVILLVVSNVFMTFAWYGHLKHRSMPLVSALGEPIRWNDPAAFVCILAAPMFTFWGRL